MVGGDDIRGAGHVRADQEHRGDQVQEACPAHRLAAIRAAQDLIPEIAGPIILVVVGAIIADRLRITVNRAVVALLEETCEDPGRKNGLGIGTTTLSTSPS